MAKKNDVDSKATIYFRLRDGKKDIKAASELSINPNHWSPEKQGYKDRVALVPEDEKMDLNHKVQALTRMIENEYRDTFCNRSHPGIHQSYQRIFQDWHMA